MSAQANHDLDTDVTQQESNVAMPSQEESVNDNTIQQDVDAISTPADEGAEAVFDPDAMEIDGLEERFTRILNNKMIKVTAPNSLIVPKDYSMQYANLLGSHETQAKLYEKRLKERQLRNQANGNTKKQRRRKRSPKPGFDPAEIVRKRALDFGKMSSIAQSSTLSCDILPFFRVENFHGCPDNIYEEMKPGLRLATLLITQKVCSTYWHTLWFGERQICEATSNKLSKPCFRIKKDVPWSAQNSYIFSQVLAQQANRVHFFFHPRPIEPTPCYASMAWVTDMKDPFPNQNGATRGFGSHHSRAVSNGDPDTILRGKICLHTDFYTVAKRLSKLSHRDPAAVLRFNFWLSISLCHELAHFLEWVRRRMIPSHGHEAFWYDDAWNEAGESWERKTWGGRVEPVASRADCVYGIATVDWPLKRWDDAGEEMKDTDHQPGIQEADQPNVYWTIPMEFISKIQQQDTWDKLANRVPGSTDDENVAPTTDVINDKTFHIPRVGTKSIELLTLDLKGWDDEAQDGLISDEIDDEETILKRTFDGRIIKSRKKEQVITKQTAKVKGQPNNVIAKIKKKRNSFGNKPDDQEGNAELAEGAEAALEAQTFDN